MLRRDSVSSSDSSSESLHSHSRSVYNVHNEDEIETTSETSTDENESTKKTDVARSLPSASFFMNCPETHQYSPFPNTAQSPPKFDVSPQKRVRRNSTGDILFATENSVPESKKRKRAVRCSACASKLTLVRFDCSCGGVFCVRHRSGLASNVYGSMEPDRTRPGHLCCINYKEKQKLYLEKELGGTDTKKEQKKHGYTQM